MTHGLRSAWTRLAAAVALAAAVGAACSAAPARRSPADLGEELVELGLAAELADPIRLDDSMREWARASLPTQLPSERRLEALLQRLLARPEAPFRYRPGRTTDLREAWESGRANCLTFTHLFVGLAREVGVAAYYLRVSEVTSFDRDGDLVVVTDHVTAAAGEGIQQKVIDFSDRPVRRYVDVEPISDRHALALHYSNLGAEAIRAGGTEAARRHLEIATKIAPELADGWVNLGVALRRDGDLAAAEASYRQALVVDPEAVSAYHNLAALLDWRGRGAEARRLLAAVSPGKLRNPWSALALGGIALRGGQLDEAYRLFRRARRLLPDSADPWIALAEWALAAGQPERARRSLERAERREPGRPRATAIRARLPPA